MLSCELVAARTAPHCYRAESAGEVSLLRGLQARLQQQQRRLLPQPRLVRQVVRQRDAVLVPVPVLPRYQVHTQHG